MKNSYIIDSKEDIIQRLFILDEKIGGLKLRHRVKFCIFGGAAFLLRTDFRPTSDIDVYLLHETENNSIEAILNEVDINSNLQRILEMPPKEDFIKRMEKLKVEFDYIDVYIASAYDLIISKLFSTRGEKDAIDLIRTDLLDQVDEETLRELYKELKSYTIFREHRYNDLDEILEKRKEYVLTTSISN